MSASPASQSVEAVLDEHRVERDGLRDAEADRRRATVGPNEIASEASRSPLAILIAQFDSTLIWVLVAAAILSAVAGHAIDAVLILVIVVANGVFGFVQDYRAEASLDALREMAAPTARVRRDGSTVERAAPDLVPGDVITLQSGDVVPADARVIAATGLEVDEATLTGESVPVGKAADPVAPATPLADQTSMVHKGTSVTRGSGVAVVTGTGMDTAVGSIATELSRTEETDTPLQVELDRLGRRLGMGVIGLAVLVVPLLYVRGTGLVETLLTAVSLAVAAVPEGLPAVVTLTLALGVRKMADENALVRRLPAVEALGSVDTVCTDKTGTLTAGRMTAARAWIDDESIDLDGDGAGSVPDAEDRLNQLFEAAVLCSDATAEAGDPTEQALVEAAADRGIDAAALRERRPLTDEVPFSSERKWMGTAHDDWGYVKGAPEVVVELCDRVATADGSVPIDDRRAAIEDRVAAFGDDALRTLAVARTSDPETLDAGLELLGLVGMIDPAREEVADAISATHRAGIDVVMITGDNRRTASAIAETVGIEGEVMEGAEIEALSDAELESRVESVRVFARTTPTHKVRILRAFQATGHTVAMTGDGVNDAPALKNADVGVAMGERGTDVAKQSSDVILLDDNYATIERAIERGRAIFDNVWKFVAYLLSANVAEVAIVFLASLGGYLVLPAVQLLWINLLTDGLPALALGADPQSGDVMDRPPRDPDRGIVGSGMLTLIAGLGVVSVVLMLGLLAYTLDGAAEMTAYAMTMVFTGFVVLEFEKLFVVRWLRETPMLSNRWLAAAIGVSLTAQLAVLYTPLTAFFGTVPLALADWALLGAILALALPAYLFVAVLVRRVRAPDQPPTV
ncbi:cation-translocating P-type ATPase [Halococcoides cellulosivorans]|uniref:Haloacid dehalogenase n=1 Tax=Halococcoides cellulosivorans TaxID=1679096 RepID=A0A2R4X250_9EURY|nr:cation-translocating P-type ATPase [Halococcoides cellulosivorans]AWB27872.1 haloacid dehalogenase [Halococcoides cellulosivorans]